MFAKHDKDRSDTVWSRPHVQEAVKVIEKALSLYPLEKMCISFNGGKDCSVVLHIVIHTLKSLTKSKDCKTRLIAFYSLLPNYFEEEFEFVNSMVKLYNLELLIFKEPDLKRSLEKLKEDRPELEGIFIGSRKDDLPSCTNLKFFDPTDQGWPKFIRINPILNWTYQQVWDVIRDLSIPYCNLYNQGYSSIGTKVNTYKNSKLIHHKEDGSCVFLPPWSLSDSKHERLCRSTST